MINAQAVTRGAAYPDKKIGTSCGLTLELRSGFARSGVFVGGRKRCSALPHWAHPQPLAVSVKRPP